MFFLSKGISFQGLTGSQEAVHGGESHCCVCSLICARKSRIRSVSRVQAAIHSGDRSMKKFPLHTLVIFIAIVFFRTAFASAQIAPTNIEVTASPKQSLVGRIGVTLSRVELEDTFQRQSTS